MFLLQKFPTFFKIKFKVLLDFFQKIAVPKGRAFGCASQSAEALSEEAYFLGKLPPGGKEGAFYKRKSPLCIKAADFGYSEKIFFMKMLLLFLFYVVLYIYYK